MMDTRLAFAMGQIHKDDEPMVFDWEKAARIIKENPGCTASAGLSEDWEYTGGTIFEDGKPVYDESTYLGSKWATPELVVNGITQDCFVMQSERPEWDARTRWPAEALAILSS